MSRAPPARSIAYTYNVCVYCRVALGPVDTVYKEVMEPAESAT